MTGYNLESVLNEILDERANMKGTARGKTTGAKVEIYDNSWTALNAWIESKLAKQMGAGISGFGCFCWEVKQVNNETNIRPIFIISDTFVKNFKVKRERIHKLPRTTAIEEVNYSLLAIKFSKTLTKDMVFTGVRDIVRKIGDFIFRGYEICIDFTFGQLISKERRVKFEFNINRLQQILPESVSPSGLVAYDDALLPYSVEEESNEALSSRVESQPQSRASTALPTKVLLPKLNLSQPSSDLKSTLPPTTPIPATPLTAESADKNSYESFSSTQEQDAYEETYSKTYNDELPAELRDLLNAIAKTSKTTSKDEFRAKAREKVIDQAFLRCLENAENDALSNEKVSEYAKQAYYDWKTKTNALKQKSKEHEREIRQFLDTQVAEKMQKTAEEQAEKKNSVMGLLLSRVEHVMDRKEKQAISKGLADQINQNTLSKLKEKEDAVNRERDYLKQLSLEIDLHAAMSRANHLEKQKALLEAWEREGHIRNLRKVETYGKSAVDGYIQENLSETTSTLKFPAATLGKSLNKSIGYDPRRGKI